MFEIKEKPKLVERAFLVGLAMDHVNLEEARDLLRELNELVNTLGIPIVGETIITLKKPQARFLLGTGKAQEVCDEAAELQSDILIFDHELAPAQQRNWEELSKITVIDRHEVILDIFATRAQTKEARLQVDLARMEYSLPRLKRAWTHLGQQAGGIGGKGEGESQIELDRRMIRRQIDTLKKELSQVRKRRDLQRKDRRRTPIPNTAIVGYTNAGKSSLLRRLTEAEVLVEDKLFATLDTTTRKLKLPNNQDILLTDTVGFVRNLPHRLVEAFNATLEESVLADVLLHVLDANAPRVLDYYQTTMRVLQDLGAEHSRILTVFNKVDAVDDSSVLAGLRLHFPEAVFISAQTGQGLDAMLERLGDLIGDTLEPLRMLIPHDQASELAALHRVADILDQEYVAEGACITAMVPWRHRHRFLPYQLEDVALESNPLLAEEALQVEATK
ncbi:MAG: GTPase HflX [Verrucomicrobiales bacterium]